MVKYRVSGRRMHMKKIFTFRRVITFVLIVIAILFSVVSAFVFCRDNPILERLCWTFQIISSIFVIAGVVIAVWQYYLSSQDSRINLEIVQVQRAIDLSEYYKDNILAYFPAIRYIYENSGITDYINRVKQEQMVNFDFQELNSVFSEKDIEKLKEIQSSDKFIKAVLDANVIYDLGLNIVASQEGINKNEANKGEMMIRRDSVATAFTSNLILKVLNNMEFFALHFNHGTADESVVYQSLHSSYIEIVNNTYYYIAKYNKKTTDKLYTNVIWLYKIWTKKNKAQEEIRVDQATKIESHGTRIPK